MASRENARRFHFLREIASGGFGTVYLCKVHHADGFTRLAAVKILKQQWSDTAEVVKRIRDEARLLGLLRHRAIVTVYDLTSIDGRAAVVMEYIEGVDLRTVVKTAASRLDAGDAGAQVPVRAALDVGSAVASALDAAYNRPPMPGEKPLRVIHRDIKPSNIMVDGQGDVKVLDFGVARSDIENRESHTEELQFGSVDYMAPERLFFEPETPAGDVYGLGATLYELLALQKLGKARGRPEQHAAMVEDQLSFLQGRLRVRGTVATELIDVLRASLAWRHEDRPTAAELQQRCRALARLVEDEELSSWAEREIPPLFEAAARKPRKPNPLDDSVRTEDSISRARTGGFAEPPADGRLGQAVQRGALRELEDSSAFERAPVAPASSAPAAYQTLEPADDPAADWDDIPTHVGALDDPTAAPEPLSQDIRPVAGPAVNPQAFAPPTGAPPLGGARGNPRHTMVPEDPSDVAPRGGFAAADDLDDDLDDEYAQEATAVDVEDDAPAAGFDEALPGPVAVAGLEDAHSVTATADGPTPLVQPAPTPVTRRASKRPVVLGALAGGCLLFVVSAVVSIGLAALVTSGTITLPARPGDARPASPLAEVAEVEDAGATAAEAAGEEAAGEEAAGEEAPAEEPAAQAAALVFESRAPDTRKLRVVCTEGEAKGADTATVAVAAAERCTVTAIMQDRSRMVAVVDDARAGTYGCFADGASACERE